MHVVQRGNNRSPVFVTADDRQYYLAYLLDTARVHDIAIHAYVLMTNHVHLLISPARGDSLPRTMQTLGRRYVGRFNAVHERTGTLWEGRYKATAVDKESYLFACMRYIELNPVRAGLVAHPLDYPWSSAQANAMGKRDPLVTPHPLFSSIGRCPEERQRVYLPWLNSAMDAETIGAIRDATNYEWALGDSQFRRQMPATAGRRGERARPGRPIAPAAGKMRL